MARTTLTPGDLVRVIRVGCQCDGTEPCAAHRLEGTVARITTVTPTRLDGIDFYHLSGLTVGFYGDELELVTCAHVGAE